MAQGQGLAGCWFGAGLALGKQLATSCLVAWQELEIGGWGRVHDGSRARAWLVGGLGLLGSLLAWLAGWLGAGDWWLGTGPAGGLGLD